MLTKIADEECLGAGLEIVCKRVGFILILYGLLTRAYDLRKFFKKLYSFFFLQLFVLIFNVD